MSLRQVASGKRVVGRSTSGTNAFIMADCVPLDGGHNSGQLTLVRGVRRASTMTTSSGDGALRAAHACRIAEQY